MHKRRTSQGFSIIEMAVVMVVLGLLLTSAIPNITTWLRNSKLRNQAESMLTGLQQARNEAVRRNRSVSFWMVNLPTATAMNSQCTLSSTGTSWVVSAADPTGHCGDTPDFGTAPRIVATRVGLDGSTGVSVSGLASDGSTAANSVTFDGFGRAASGGVATVTVSYATPRTNDRPLHIEISTSGQARLCDPAVTDTTDPRHCVTVGTAKFQ